MTWTRKIGKDERARMKERRGEERRGGEVTTHITNLLKKEEESMMRSRGVVASCLALPCRPYLTLVCDANGSDVQDIYIVVSFLSLLAK